MTELEAGNYEADDSEVKQRFDNQRQLNMQLQVNILESIFNLKELFFKKTLNLSGTKALVRARAGAGY